MLSFLATIIFGGLALGFFIALVAYVPTFIYAIPYYFWLSGQSKVKYEKQQKEGYWRSIRNATRLYKAWINHTEPTF